MATPVRFRRYEIAGLPARPDWWQVRPEEVAQAVRRCARGKVFQIATTPLGFPVWAVAYGKPRPPLGTATWASGSNSRDTGSYRVNEEAYQVVVIVCGVHGAEAEAVAGAVNLLSLLETGADLRGRRRPRLTARAGRYRLVILPCVNMDGRSLSPDHLRGASPEEFVKASQGIWKDGSAIGYPACKEYAPLPLDRVSHPGGYPNGDGYNIMHDACPGDLRTDEARGLLKLVADEQADLILHMHSHSTGSQVLGQSLLAYPLHVERTHAYKTRIRDALARAGLRPGPVLPKKQRGGINLTTACTMASGGLSFVFEQPAVADWTFDEMLETFYRAIETVLDWGLKEPFSPRHLVAAGRVEG